MRLNHRFFVGRLKFFKIFFTLHIVIREMKTLILNYLSFLKIELIFNFFFFLIAKNFAV